MTSILDVKARDEELEIIDPITQEPMGLVINLRSASSPEVSAVNKKYQRKIRDLMMKRKSTIALEEERDIEFMAAAISGWEWKNATLGGKTQLDPLEFTPENVRAVLKAKQLGFIRRQIDQKLSEEGDFLAV